MMRLQYNRFARTNTQISQEHTFGTNKHGGAQRQTAGRNSKQEGKNQINH